MCGSTDLTAAPSGKTGSLAPKQCLSLCGALVLPGGPGAGQAGPRRRRERVDDDLQHPQVREDATNEMITPFLIYLRHTLSTAPTCHHFDSVGWVLQIPRNQRDDLQG